MFAKRLGQGRDRALQYLRENPVLHDEIEKVHIPTSVEPELSFIISEASAMRTAF